MKKILLYCLPLCLLFASCSDLLDEESYSETGKDNYLNNAKEAETVLQGVYKNLANEYTYSYHLSLLFTISTDIAQCEGSSTTSFREIPTNSHNASTSQISRTWQKLYSAIYDANDFIETVSGRMDNWGSSDRELATIYLGEARALRALFYFELVRWYGNVVLMTSTADSRRKDETFEQTAAKDVYAYIEEDLKYAAEVLPWAVDDTRRTTNAYRFSKGAALGLLAKVYCTWAGYPVRDESKWAEDEKAARRVVESGKHRLISDYETVWKNTCNGIWDAGESLIEVSFYSPTGLDSDNTAGRIGKWNGVSATTVEGERGRNAANWKVTYNFTREWEAQNDPRMALSIADYKYDHTLGSGPITYFSTISGATPSEEPPASVVHAGQVGHREVCRSGELHRQQRQVERQLVHSALFGRAAALRRGAQRVGRLGRRCRGRRERCAPPRFRRHEARPFLWSFARGPARGDPQGACLRALLRRPPQAGPDPLGHLL